MGKSLKELIAEQKAVKTGPSFGAKSAPPMQPVQPAQPIEITVPQPAPVTGVKFGAKPGATGGIKIGAASTPLQPAAPPSAPVTPQNLTVNVPTPAGDVLQRAADDLRASLDYLRENIDHPDVLGATVRNIARQLIAMPELHPLMQNTDANLVVRALRASYQTAARVKQEKTQKRGVKSQMLDEAEKLMKEMGFATDGDGTPDADGFGF